MCRAVIFVFVLLVIEVALSAKVFNVLDFGAKGDGLKIDTLAVQNTIKAATGEQGSTVYFPPGKYLCGPVNLTSNIVLLVSPEATILGLQDLNQFGLLPPFPSYGVAREKGTINRYAPIIGAYNCTNLTITGGGVIDGQGSYWWNLFKQSALKNTRPRLLEFEWCTNLKIENMTFLDSPFWTVHPIYCDNVHINKVMIRAPSNSPNTDGIDPDSSSNVLIENCDISCGDDMIAVKSGINMSGILFGKPSQNITIRNSRFGAGHGLSLGSESSGGIENVTFEHLTLTGSQRVVQVKTSRGRGSYIRDITYTDIVFTNILADAIHVGMNYDNVPTPGNKTTTPVVSNITIRNLKGTAKYAGHLDCLPESPCHQFLLEDIQIDAPRGFECTFITGKSVNVSPNSCVAQ